MDDEELRARLQNQGLFSLDGQTTSSKNFIVSGTASSRLSDEDIQKHVFSTYSRMNGDIVEPSVSAAAQSLNNDELQSGIALLEKALAADNQKDAKLAVYYYSKSIHFFLKAMSMEKDPNRKSSIRKKVATFLQRAEDLKRTLAAEEAEKEKARTFEEDLSLGRTFDECKDYAEAIKMYTSGIGKLLQAVKQMSERDATVARGMAHEYLKRTEMLQRTLEAPPIAEATVVSATESANLPVALARKV